VGSDWKVIGEVCVDTARLVICDPWHAGIVSKLYEDGAFIDVDPDTRLAAELKNEHDMPVAIVLQSGSGDGRYTVEARYEIDPHFGPPARIAEIRIRFLPYPYPQIDADDTLETAVQ
jgi:hypothetical protein